MVATTLATQVDFTEAGEFMLFIGESQVSYLENMMWNQGYPMNALMAWNADLIRMPYRMHFEYLRQLFLNNDLANGHYRVGDWPVVIQDIRAPLFVVSTTTDL